MSKGEAIASSAPLAFAEIWWRRAGSAAAWVGYLFLVLPSLLVIPVSFNGSQELQFPPQQLSMHLYAEFFSDRTWWGAALRSVLVGTVTSVMAVLIAFPAAYALARSQSKLSRVSEPMRPGIE